MIENRGGAGGTIGVADVARAPADGYTLLLGSNGTHILSPLVMSRLTYDPIKDFDVVSIFAMTSTSITVHPSVQARTLHELILYAKANPGKLSYAHGGIGGPSHIAGEMFKTLAGGLDIVPVPYKGMGPAQADVISGNVPMAVPNVTGQLLGLYRAEKIRILAVNSPTRYQALPDVPTAIEAGVPGMIAQNFFGIFAPANTPKDVMLRVDNATQAALSEIDFREQLAKSGFEPLRELGGEKAKTYVKEEYARWEPIVRATGARID